jgi:lysyl endopeptidase
MIRKTVFLLGFVCSQLAMPVAAVAQSAEPGIPLGQMLKADDVPVCLLPAIPLRSLQIQDSVLDQEKGVFRFGFNHFLNCNLSNSGKWVRLNNGDRVWRIRIMAHSAQSINIGFNYFHLPKGAKLFVYTPDHLQMSGAFTENHNHPDGEMGTDLILSDDVIVEYDEPAGVEGKGSLTIFRVTQGYRSARYFRSFGQAGNCIQNVNCPEGDPWKNQKRSVVCVVSNGNEFCSGALINTTSNDGTPYILTASHVGPPTGSWVFRFNWESPGCANPSVAPSVSQSISGAIPVAQNAGSDFSLCKMSAVPPASFQVFYAGWSALNVASDSVCGIHHPSGDIKKISLSKNPSSTAVWNGASVWKTGIWTEGYTESGSSGSPLFDQDRRIVGQLFGGSSGCGVPTIQDFDYYGQFAVSWNNDTLASGRLHDWLDPGNTGALTNDGFDPNGLFVNETPKESFKLFPNPSQRFLHARFESLQSALSIELYDNRGVLMIAKRKVGINSTEFVIDLVGLAPGFYLLKLITGKSASVRKIILD